MNGVLKITLLVGLMMESCRASRKVWILSNSVHWEEDLLRCHSKVIDLSSLHLRINSFDYFGRSSMLHCSSLD